MAPSTTLKDAVTALFPKNKALVATIGSAIDSEGSLLSAVDAVLGNGGLSLDDAKTLQWIKSSIDVAAGNEILASFLLQQDPPSRRLASLALGSYYSTKLPAVGDGVLQSFRANLLRKAPLAVLLASIKAGKVLGDDDPKDAVTSALSYAVDEEMAIGAPEFSRAIKDPTFFSSTGRGGVDADKVLDLLMKLQRLQCLVAEPGEIDKLRKARFYSAHDIASQTKASFIRAMQGMGRTAASKVHDNAVIVDCRNEVTWVNILTTMNEDFLATKKAAASVTEKTAGRPEGRGVVDSGGKSSKGSKQSFNMTEIFDLQFTPCAECNSITSASAYFVDLLGFLEQSRCDASKAGFHTLLEALSDRRPDLRELKLSCANSKNLIPYIAIVNEIMESFIARNGGTGGAAPIQVVNEADEDGAGSGGMAVALGEQTTQVFQDQIGTQMHPLKFFPYNQGQDAARMYLAALDISPSEMATTFKSAAYLLSQFVAALPDDAASRQELMAEADVIWHRADVANTLHLLPLDFSAISRTNIYTAKFLDLVAGLSPADSATGPLSQVLSVPEAHLSWGYADATEMLSQSEDAKTGLCFIRAQLLPRSGLSFEELLGIINTTYFGRRLVITNITKSKVFSGQLSEMRLQSLDATTGPSAGIGPLTEQLCHELQGFIRLKNKLGWTIEEVDVAIASLTENHVSNCVAGSVSDFRGITYRLLEDLSHVVKLADLTGLSAASLFPLWATIGSRGKNSTYQKVFLGPIGFLSDDVVFKAGPSGKYFEVSDAIENHVSALTMALQLGNEDLDTMMAAAGVESNQELSMDVLSRLYRHTMLCRMLDARPKDYLAILSAFSQPNVLLNPKTTLDAVASWKQLRKSGWSTAEILLMVASPGGNMQSELLPVSDAALGLTGATAEKFDSLRKTWDSRLLGGIVTQQDVLDLCNQLFDATTARSIALLVEGSYVTSTTLYPDASVSIPPPGTRPILADKLVVKFDKKSTGEAVVTITLKGLLSDEDRAEALDTVKAAKFFVDAVQEIDKLSKIPYQALLSRLSSPADKDTQAAITRLLVEDAADAATAPTPSAAPADNIPDGQQEEEALQSALEAEKQLRARRADFVKLALPILQAQAIEDLAVRVVGEKVSDVEAAILPLLLHQEKQQQQQSAISMLRDVQYLSETNRDIKAGYFRPSATDWYTFRLPSPAGASESDPGPDLFINGVRLDLKRAGGGRDWRSDRIMMTNGQSYLLTSSSVPLSAVAWETKQSASTRFTSLTLLDQASVATVGAVLARISRKAYLVKKLELSSEELQYFSTPGGLAVMDLDALALHDLGQLETYRQLRDAAAKDRQALMGLLGWLAGPNPGIAIGELATRLAATTTWPQAQLSTALAAKYANMPPADVLGRFRGSFDELASLQAVMDVSSRVLRPPPPGKAGVAGAGASGAAQPPLVTLFRTAAPGRPGSIARDFACANDLRMLLRPRQLAQCTAELRERQRTALVEYLLQQPYIKARELFDADALFDYFLVDVQMGAQLEITRMKQAISTVQIYVQRCLLGLETDAGVTSSCIDRERWLWTQKHNVWTATRKAVLYPENWIDPTLRDDKTPLFDEFETTILQKDLDWDSFSRAMHTYVQGLLAVSDLDLLAYLRQHPTASSTAEIYHFFGRTRSAPFKFYYRSMRLGQPHNVVRWSPWTLIEMDSLTYEADWDGTTIPYSGSYLLPVIRGSRLLLFLPQIMVKTLTPSRPQKPDKEGKMQPISYAEDVQRPPGDPKTAVPKNWEIRLAWTELLNGQWTAKRVSQAALVVDWDPSFEKEPLPSLARFTFQTRTSGDTATISVGCWRSGSGGQANSHSLGTFVISEDRVTVARYGDPHASTQTTLPTAFHKFAWDSEAARPGQAQVDVPAAAVAPYGGAAGTAQAPLLAVPAQTVKRRLVWTLSYNGNDDLNSSACGLVVEEQPGDGKPARSLFMYPELVGMNPKTRAELASRNLVDNSWQEVVEHQQAPSLMQAISEPGPDGLAPLFDAMSAGVTVKEYGKAVVEAGMSSYYELATSYALYNWEAGMHCVLLAVDRFLATQQFELALRAARLVFDPTVDAVGANADEAAAACWRFPPFRDIALNKAEIYDRFEGWSDGDTSLAVAVTERRSSPGSSHASARARPKAYMKWIVMKYIETLIAAGDEYFRQGSLEALPLAIQRYIEAVHVLGPEPPAVPRLGRPVVHSYASLPDKGGAMEVRLNLAFPFLGDVEPRGSAGDDPARQGLLGLLRTTYFCLPPNPRYQSLRDLVHDRLYKARNNLDINGRPIVYAMTEPAIDPGALLRALGGGGSGGVLALLNDSDSPMPYQRFSFLVAKALELCADLRAAGEQFLAAKEKRDAEALALLKARQDTARQTMTLGARQLQREELVLTAESLRQNREAAASQLAYYLQLIGEAPDRIPTEKGEWVDVPQSIDAPQTDDLRLNRHEAEEMRMAALSGGLNLAASGVDTWVAMLRALPRITTNTEPMGLGVSIKIDGENLAEAAGAASVGLRTLAYAASEKGGDAARKATLTRQLQERRLQANIKGREVKSLDKQLEIQRKRLEIHDRETELHRAELEHAAETERWYMSKYTGERLYAWMENAVRAVHYDLYQLAADMARRAERALTFERVGAPPAAGAALRPGGYWDAGRDGLLAAQQLQLDLRRLEVAYVDRPLHDYELSKNVSLRQLDPLALLTLRARGVAAFSLPEVLFDLDFPGHYLRRIRSVALSVACVMGAHTSLGATLSLTQHRYRVSAVAGGPDDYASDDNPERFRSDRIPLTAVALSTGTQDAGVFELSPASTGERFQPFEGAGALSSWRLELPPVARAAFDYGTISDVVLHLRYTAVDGGPLLRQTAGLAAEAFLSRVQQQGQAGDGAGLFALFDLRNDLSREWQAFRAALDAKRKAELDLSGLKARLPYWVRARTAVATTVSLLVSGPGVRKADLAVDKFSIPALGTKDWDRTTLGTATQLTRAPLNSDLAGDGWKLVATNDQGKFTGVENISLVLQYALTSAKK